MALRLITLGSPRVLSGDLELIDLPSQRLRFALLVYLAVEGEASRDGVLTLFWPDRAASRGKHALRQMLYELRQLLGEDWIELGRDRIAVRAAIDAAEFEDAAGQDASAALELYGGPFLDGFSLDNRGFEGWVDRRRAHFGRLHRRLRRERIDALLSAGNPEAALNAAQRWVELDALDDEASHALIRCLALGGQRLEALQYYETYERQLAAELQVEPLDETRELVERIRNGELAPALPPETAPERAGLEVRSANGVPRLQTGPLPDPAVSRTAHAAGTASAVTNAAPEPASSDGPASQARREADGRDGPAAASRRSEAPESARASDALPWLAAARRPWRARALAGVGFLIVAAVVLTQFGEPPRPTAVTPSTRIIVLPFSDRSGDSALISLAGALTETLARDLAQSQPLDVVSPTGIALMRERGVTDDSVGRLLSADYLVSGSIASGPDWVRVGVELLDGRTGSLIRSDVIERSRQESRILVDDVITRTAGILRREVGNHVEVRRVRASTASEEAWRAVLEARALQEPIVRLIRYRDYDGFERTMERSDSLLTRAGELDRRWAEPLVLRGWLMERRAFVSLFRTPADTASRRKLLEAAASLADRATERDPRDPRAYELRGTVQHQLALLPDAPREVVRGRLTAAEDELRRATQLDPNSSRSWLRLAELLRESGRYAAAKNAAERAYRIDRFVGEANSIIVILFSTSLELGEDEDAERWCAEGRRTFDGQLPFLYCLFALHAWADRVPADPARLRRELREYQESQAVLQPQLLARLETLLAAAHARAGEQDSARAILRRTASEPGDPALLWMRAGALTALGEHDEALESLEAYLARDTWEAHIVGQSRPFWRMRGRAEYERLVRF